MVGCNSFLEVFSKINNSVMLIFHVFSGKKTHLLLVTSNALQTLVLMLLTNNSVENTTPS